MATTTALTENSRQGINFQIPPCIGPEAWLSPNPRPGCGHAYDETPVGLVVYVRNDPVNRIDPDGRSDMYVSQEINFEEVTTKIFGRSTKTIIMVVTTFYYFDIRGWDPERFGPEYLPGAGGETWSPDDAGGGLDLTDGEQRPCQPAPLLPSRGIPNGEIERNIKEAHDFFDAQLLRNPEGAMSALFGFFISKFWNGGKWDYKAQYNPFSEAEDRNVAQDFGNFNFGAVLQSFGFTYTFTQNAAGLAQILISVTGGTPGTGIPGLKYPFGDQISDAMVIKRGFDYQAAKQQGCR